MIKKLLSSQLRVNMASGVVTAVINIAVIAVGYPIYLHFLGYEKYGVWLVLATVLTFVQLGNLGIGQAIMKLVAEEYGRENIEGVQQYVTTALALLCLSGSFILIVILSFKSQIIAVFKLSDENAQMAFWLLPYIGILSVYVLIIQTLNTTLSGMGRMDLANYIQSAGRIVAVITAGSLLYCGYGIESLLIGNTLSCIFIHIASLIFIWRISRIRFLRKESLDIQCCKRLLCFGGGVFGGSVINMFLSPFNKLILSRYVGVSSIPVYEIAYNGSMQVKGLVEVGLRALMPEISRLSINVSAESSYRVRQLSRKAMKIAFFSGVSFYIALFFFLPLLLKFWLQDKFVSGLPMVFRIILFGICFSLTAVPAYYLLLGLGKVFTAFLTNVIRASCNLLLIFAVVIVSGRITIEQVSICVLTAWVLSTIFIVYKAQCILSSLPLVAESEVN